MPRYKLTLEYDGTDFSGFQRQNDVVTVQGVIEEAIRLFADQHVTLVTAGRTDAGVHALGQVCHVDIDTDLSADRIMGAINFHVRPHAVSILNVEQVDNHFHARFDATKRYYRYEIINRRAPLMIENNRAWHVPIPLDINAMQEAAKYLIGKHDFTSFRDSQCQSNSPIKTLDTLNISQKGERIIIQTSALSYLHHMVRNLVGTLKFVGEGKFSPEDIKSILAAKDRTTAGPTAPACGLYFVRVEY